MRLILAIRCFFLVLFARRLPADAAALLPPSPTEEPAKALPPQEAEVVREAPVVKDAPVVKEAPRSDDGVRGAVQLLGVLQREGRLLDFLQEEIDGYSDAQIGAAVRDIHRGCKKALADYIPVEPVLAEPENAKVRIDAGFDPSRIRIVGNVLGEPPWSGTLRHHGWRTAQVKLPPPAVAADPTVVAPAEVEL